QAAVGGDDAVPVSVGVVAGGDLVVGPILDQRGHRVGRRAVHPDPAVGVERHERPPRIDLGVDDGEVQSEVVGDVAPVVDARPTHRVGADLDVLLPYGIQVQHRGEVVAVTAQVVPALHLGGGLLIAGAADPVRGAHQLVGAGRNRRGGVGAGRAGVRRVGVEAAVEIRRAHV